MNPYTNDKTLRESLYMLLLQYPADEILENWKLIYCGFQPNTCHFPTQISSLISKIHPDRFSESDAQQLVAGLQEQYFAEGSCGIFQCILDFAEQVMTLESGMPEIRFSEILRWRDTVHPIGTIPFLAAFLAYEDLKVGRDRIDFTINPVLSTDNKRLKYILSKGMAENHFHLNGSAPSFMISWVRLMNNPVFDSREWVEFRKIQGEGGHQKLPNWKTLLYKAAVIRAMLFCILSGVQRSNSANACTKVSSELVINFLNVLTDRKLPEQTGDDVLSALKVLYKWQASGDLGDNWGIHDYALTLPSKELAPEQVASMIFAGEIRFQYMVFRSIFQNNTDVYPYLNLFHAYLAIQCQFRGEFIENDHRFGLENFCRYDQRKKSFFEDRDRKIQKIIPVLEHLCDSRVLSLEARIVPDEDECALRNQVTGIDAIIRKELEKTTASTSEITSILQRLHYVLHFVKARDNPLDSTVYSPACRHKFLRDRLKKEANGIINLRENDRETALRIIGIDACSNEIYARPEVFAAEFRRLRNHTPKVLCAWQPTLPPLYITYHVGEDFLDVADGLRAVWEAVNFLELGRTSRIGHGLVLGIDIEEWYEKKQYRIYLSRQALLDNCVWLLKYLDLNSSLEDTLRFELLQYIETLFAEIYQNSESADFFSIDSYWNAMQLRGDDPEAYQEISSWKQFQNTLDLQSITRPFALRANQSYSLINSIRRNQPTAVQLYHRYHYDPDVRRRGEKSIEFHITLSMVHGIIQAQKILRQSIAQEGIAIETNPSSNVLIGNFNRYEKHPIFSFNDNGLFNKPDTPNISVSINTDDQGIFDTSLENEYALLARALEQMHDSKGDRIVDQDHIYGWLDHVREMGIFQSFYQYNQNCKK